MSLYFALLLATIAVPLALSFDRRLQFYKKWKVIFPSILIVAAVYVTVDVFYTRLGVWGFNPKYLSGITLINLPLEEILFFVAVPYASLFLHFSVVEYFPKLKAEGKIVKAIILLLFVFCLVVAALHYNKLYTVYIFTKTALLLLFAFFYPGDNIRAYLFTFLVILVPFVLVNGILTGSFIEGEIVWYLNDENLGLRFLTIPLEDFAYAFSMILFNLLLLDFFERKILVFR